MSRAALIATGVVLAIGAAISTYVLLVWDAWIPAIAAMAGTVCVLLPIFGWHQHVTEERLHEETQAKLKAHKISTEGYLAIVREKDQEMLAEARRQDALMLQQLDSENFLLRRENFNLKNILARIQNRARDPVTGRWLKAKLEAPTIEGTSTDD